MLIGYTMKSNKLRIKVGLFLMMGVFLIFLVYPSVFAEEQYCKNIYCWVFDYITCCSHKTDETTKWSQVDLKERNPDGGKYAIACPSDIATKQCHMQLSIISGWWIDGDVEVFIGSGNCRQVETSIYHGKRWKCTNEISTEYPVGSNPGFDLDPGESIYIWGGEDAIISIGHTEVYKLKRSGAAATCAGEDVEGSVGCTLDLLRN